MQGKNTTALLLIDIQNDYFPNGAFELDGAAAAGEKAGQVLAAFREQGRPVIHIQHEAVAPGSFFFLPETEGVEIHSSVRPVQGEAVLTKHYPNSFRETGLHDLLQELGVQHLVVAGMMSLMCVDATVRAAFDLGYCCTVLHDACAARSLVFDGVEVSASQVHAAFMAALQMRYAQISSCEAFLEACQRPD
ncbi:cysteine hydrolase [Desulfovibrio mangrovi]|uniref:cysteine hydrolase family protein n=1 Tax=Desulfovibrio mangrovi TaxID=2976983 RepID=UPI002245BE31|nr:cysteine hydrolase family protein [Desulfovibrio mangrovi]UZP65946.1 cysteine hydrolase [Desulfovibrio mangrovi]